MRPRPFLLLIAGFALALMAAGEADAKEPLWSYDTGNGVGSVAISADGEYIAVGSGNDTVYLFDKDSSTPLWSYDTGSYVYSVAISADGEYIAAGSEDGRVYLFNKDSSTPIWSYETGSSEAPEGVHSVAISADGEYIAAGSYDNKVYLFDKDSSTPLWNYTTGGWVYSVAISANGEYIAAGTDPSRDDLYLVGKDSSTPERKRRMKLLSEWQLAKARAALGQSRPQGNGELDRLLANAAAVRSPRRLVHDSLTMNSCTLALGRNANAKLAIRDALLHIRG